MTGRPATYYQASVQRDYIAKIRHTVRRLREFGRDPRVLYYVTSRSVRLPDIQETQLSEELNVTFKIRDAKYISSHINDSIGTRAAFDHHLRHRTDFLRQVGASTIIPPSSHVRSPAGYVFLQELARRRGDTSLIDAVTDSLALWALEGTDPDAGRFMSREDILGASALRFLPMTNIRESAVTSGSRWQLTGSRRGKIDFDARVGCAWCGHYGRCHSTLHSARLHFLNCRASPGRWAAGSVSGARYVDQR